MYDKQGELYIIRNQVNNNVYIGKTYNGIKRRFNQHINIAKRMDCLGNYICNTKLCRAIREIGEENFYIELIGRYKYGDLEKAEIDAIKKYNSMVDGYNTEPGGGTGEIIIFDEDSINYIIEMYIDFKMNINDIAKEMGVSWHTIGDVLHNLNLVRPLNVSTKMEIIDDPVYGVQSKTGHTVQFKNSYIAAEEIRRSGLSKQHILYKK